MELVFVSGETKNSTDIRDETFGITVSNAIRLKREVEIYQWVEKDGGDDDEGYTYEEKWCNYAVNSNTFNDYEARQRQRNHGSYLFNRSG
jgi:hypothetical protein